MQSPNTPDDVIKIIKNLKFGPDVRNNAPRVFCELVFGLSRDVGTRDAAARWVAKELSAILRTLIPVRGVVSEQPAADAAIRLALILWIMHFRPEKNLCAILGDVAAKPFMPRPNEWTSMVHLFRPECKTIVDLDTKQTASNHTPVYPVKVDAVGAWNRIGEFLSLVCDHFYENPVSPEHVSIMLDLLQEDVVRPRRFEITLYTCIKERKPIDRHFVYALMCLALEYRGSSPKIEAGVCKLPDRRPMNRRMACVMFAATALITFFLRCD